VPLVLAVALVGALVTAGLFWRASSDHENDAAAAQALISAGADAKSAAEAAAVQMTTYDYRTVDQDFSWIDTAGTEEFKKYFSGISAPAIKLVKQYQAAAQGTVIDSGVDVEDPTHVKVVLFVDQTITGKTEGTSAPDQSRIVMHMVLQDSRWLVDRMELKNYTRS
jgi:Mce-associated membrane protein